MKKVIIAVTVISCVALASVASANWGRGGKGGGGYGNCIYGQGQVYNQVDPAMQEKLDKFYADTQDLRKEMAVKQAEKMAMLRGDNPDPAVVAELTGKIFDLRASMVQKAQEAGVENIIGPAARRGGPGMGFNRGGRGQQRMMGGSRF